MDATVNGIGIIDLHIHIPRKGQWHGELSADSDVPLDFDLSMDLAGLPFRATARTSSLSAGTAVVEFVGGKAGLSRPVEARAYNTVPLNIPLQAIVDASGEALSERCLRDVLELQLTAWAIRKGKSGAALNMLVDVGAASVPGAVWRILPDGALWVGAETWDPVELEFEPLVVDPRADHLVGYMENPGLLPGTVFGGRKVSHVEHTLSDARLRTAVWFE